MSAVPLSTQHINLFASVILLLASPNRLSVWFHCPEAIVGISRGRRAEAVTAKTLWPPATSPRRPGQ